MKTEVFVSDTILESIEEVFQAIVDPEQLAGFFISGSSGPLQSGQKVTWYFDDVGKKFEIDVQQVIPGKLISFQWDASGSPAEVTIKLSSLEKAITEISITEKDWTMDESGVQCALGQTQGWTDFICCLKAYLYNGIRLRDGRASELHA